MPEEKHARRLLDRHKLEPPYDLKKLASLYADVEYRYFPINADGIAINIDSASRPQILINSYNSKPRQQFTLAHELGHIIIPWHTGTIISHTNTESNPRLYWEYRALEAEANRFAAELLMPSLWVEKVYATTDNFCLSIESIQKTSGASTDAVLIKFFNTIHDDGIVCAELNDAGFYDKIYKTSSAPSNAYDIKGNDIIRNDPFSTSSNSEIVLIGYKKYRIWYFTNIHHDIVETDSRTWRELLDEILYDTKLVDKKLSINSILASAFDKNKNDVESVAVEKILSAFDGRSGLSSVHAHPLFKQYVLKRTKELAARKK